MTWIKTVSMWDDERVKKAMEAQRKLYPVEYATPVHPVNNGESSSIVASHSLRRPLKTSPRMSQARSR